LAILLVFTGFKLASPKVFKHVFSQGIEQFIFFVGTLAITLFTDLLIGVFGGLFLALFVHFLLSKTSPRSFFRMIFYPGTELIKKSEGEFLLKVKGVANFLSTIKLDKLLDQVAPGSKLKVDFSEARLVDFSIQEHFEDFQRSHKNSGGSVDITGLKKHVSSSNHNLALKILTSPIRRMSQRQIKLEKLAKENNWSFQFEPAKMDYLQTFYFFETRPDETKINSVSPKNKTSNWDILDIKFEEGAYLAAEEYKTTLGLIRFPFPIPKFTIEKKVFPEKFINLADHKDIDYVIYHNFSDDFIVKVDNEEELDQFLTPELRDLIENCEVIHHLESNGEAILLFTDNLRLASVKQYPAIASLAEEIENVVNKSKN
jgi:hypothetical protein